MRLTGHLAIGLAQSADAFADVVDTHITVGKAQEMPKVGIGETNAAGTDFDTVSKILSPGLRIGWAVGDAEIVRRMALQKADGGSSPCPVLAYAPRDWLTRVQFYIHKRCVFEC